MDVAVRRARATDAPVLAAQRLEFMRIIKDGGIPDESEWLLWLERWFARGLSSGRIVAWLSVSGEMVVASAAMSLRTCRLNQRSGREGLVMSVFTLPAWRRRGLARGLMAHVIEEASALGLYRLVLQPTAMSIPLYRELGFKAFRTIMVLPLNDG